MEPPPRPLPPSPGGERLVALHHSKSLARYPPITRLKGREVQGLDDFLKRSANTAAQKVELELLRKQQPLVRKVGS